MKGRCWSAGHKSEEFRVVIKQLNKNNDKTAQKTEEKYPLKCRGCDFKCETEITVKKHSKKAQLPGIQV